MGELQAGQNINTFIWAGITVLSCVLIHFLYKIIFGSKKEEPIDDEKSSDLGKLYDLFLWVDIF